MYGCIITQQQFSMVSMKNVWIIHKQFEKAKLKAYYLHGSVMAAKCSFVTLKSTPTTFMGN